MRRSSQHPRPRKLAVNAALASAVAFAVLAGGCGAGEVRNEDGIITEAADLGAAELRAGDCVDELPDGRVTEVSVVPCDSPHRAEVMSAEDAGAESDDYDQAVIETLADDSCAAMFLNYVGIDYTASVHDIVKVTPTQESWEDDVHPDRTILCLVVAGSGRFEGSAEGIAE